MEQFLSTLLFVLPGLLCYYWIAVLGVTPSEKYNTFEMLSISVLLWVPVTVLNLGVYNLIVLAVHFFARLDYLYQLNQLQSLSGYFGFQLYYVASSLLASYIVARIIAGKGRNWFRQFVNRIRIKHGISELSQHSTVWDEFCAIWPKGT